MTGRIDGVKRGRTPGRAKPGPGSPHEWSLTGSRADGVCLLSYRPGRGGLAPPSEREIIYAALDRGFAVDDIISPEDIRGLIAAALETETALNEHPITRSSHSDIRLGMDPGRLRVELKLRKAVGGGKPLVLSGIAEVIRGSGLRGLDGPRIKAEIMKFLKGESVSAAILLKEGTAPQRGPDREMEYLVPPLDETDLSFIRKRLELQSKQKAALGSLTAFPPEAVNQMSLVKKNQVVARLGPAKDGTPGRDIDGSPIPGYPGNDPDVVVHENLRWEGENIFTLIDGVMDIGTRGDGRIHLRVREHRDAAIRITVAEDKIKAFVSTRLPTGTGAPVNPEGIRRAAEEAGVVKGLLEQEIIEVSERTQAGEIVTGHVIAEGRLPMRDDSRLSLSVSGDPAAAPVPVRAEDRIGILVREEEGGWNVLGELLMDEGTALSEGDNIRRETDNQGNTVLVAEKGGHLVMDKGVLTVKHQMEYVGDVSRVTGSIRFPGKVKIDGSVLSKAVVDGGEGVEISQVVQAALVNSGADVAIGRGIKGEGRAVVRSRGSLTLAYAEEANLLITGNINTGRALMNCRVKCNGRLVLSEGGKLIGGTMKLKDGLICGEVGNQRGVQTSVSFGQDYLVGNQIDQAEKELAKIQEFIERTDKMMMELEGRGDSRKLADVRRKKVDALKMFDKKNLRLFLLREKFEQHFPSEIRIIGTAWPGTVFESHGRILSIDAPARSIRVIFDPRKGRLERKNL